MEAVREELLKALADEHQEPEPEKKPFWSNGRTPANDYPWLILDQYLAHYGVAHRTKKEKHKGRTVHVLDACPFDPTHRDPDACVMQDESGKLYFQCFHSSCQGRRWQDFRERVGKPLPQHYDRQHSAHGRSQPHIETPEERESRPVFPTPVPLSKLQAVDLGALWRLCGYLAVGSMTLLLALWKSGKTTLVSHLLKALDRGGEFIGQRATACGILVISEEPENLWTERRDDLEIGDHVHIVVRPFRGKPDIPAWAAFCAHYAEYVRHEGIGVVIIDTLSNLWPVVDENNASEVTSAMLPLRMFTDAGAALLLIHHPRKSDGQEATAARGSGALPGFVDVILELRRFDAAQHDDRRRTLRGYSRYSATPDEVVIELSADRKGYRLVGSKQDAHAQQSIGPIMGVLPLQPPGWTVKDILEKWPDGEKPAQRTLEHWLSKGVGKHWHATGAGKSNDPKRYYAKAPGRDEEAI